MNYDEKLQSVCLNSEKYDPNYGPRLNDELIHIGTQELASYYLALKEKNARVDSDRHYVAYLLDLSDSFSGNDPPLMGDMPDIDVDFSEREPVVDYLKSKYGDDHVAYVSNYNKLRGKSALNDVARVTEVKIPKRVRDAVSALDELYKDTASDFMSIRKFLDSGTQQYSEEVMEAIRMAANLEGNVRQTGITAAGVIVSSEPVNDYAALWSSKGKIASVYDKDDVEKIGFLKMDVLVTTNIAAMDRCMKLIKERGGEPPEDIWNLPMDDGEMIREFARGNTELIFQYGGHSLKGLMPRLKPKSVEDIIAANALCRKGADDKSYIARKEGKEKFGYFHPVLLDILEDTYGIMVYQEQVMAICRQLAGMSWRDVNRVRKMVGKKTYKEEPELKKLFLMGCEKNEVDLAQADRLWAEIKKHGEYSFNRAHCVAYFLQAWANMYFQVHHPFEWFLSNLMLEKDEKVVATIVSAAQRAGVEIGEVHVNHSSAGWSYNADTLIPGLSNIKGLGMKTGEKLAKEAKRSPFVGWKERTINKKGEKRYYLVQEDPYPLTSETKDMEWFSWVPIPKNSFEVLCSAGAIPGVDGDNTQINIASGKSVDVIEDKEVHKWWSPLPLGKKEDGPCVVHGYLKNATKRNTGYELNIQGDVAETLWYHDKLEPGPYLFVTDGKWGRVALAVPEEQFSRHPMDRYEKNALLATKGPNVAFFTSSTKVKHDDGRVSYVGIGLCPQPRTFWLTSPIKTGWHIFRHDQEKRKWETKLVAELA